MRVLFLYSVDDAQSTSRPLRSWLALQFGISHVSSTLKAHGHETRLLVLGSNNSIANARLLRSFMAEFDPGVVCLTAVFSQYPFIERIAGFIKKRWPEKLLVVGGVHATLNRNEVMAGAFDVLCIGEGELPMVELCSQMEDGHSPRAIPNLWIKAGDGRIERNKPRDFLQDLDVLAFPDREMWRPWIEESVDDAVSVLLGRGCPYSCAYCCNHALREVADGAYVRMRSPRNILEEVSLLHGRHHVRGIYFEVESIAVNKTWALELSAQLEAFNSTIGHALLYGCNFRISPQSMDEELLAALKKAGLYRINIGLESGSERIRREVLNRSYSNDDFLAVVAMARKHGLSVYVFNMVGIPGESMDDHRETVRLNRQCQPEGHQTGIFFPYPGTRLYDTCVDRGFLKRPPDTRLERRRAVIEFPSFGRAEIQSAYTWFHYRVYGGYRPLWMILIRVLLTWARANPATNCLLRRIVRLPVLRSVRGRVGGRGV